MPGIWRNHAKRVLGRRRHLSFSTTRGSIMTIKEPALSGIGRVLPSDCPKFEVCSAPICPADPDWRHQVHRRGEPICFFLRMHSKNAFKALKEGSVPRQLIDTVTKVFPEICARYTPIKNSLDRASLSPAKAFSKEVTHE